MPDDVELKWKIDESILNGYPHIYYPALDYVPSQSGKWKKDADIFGGYPFCYYNPLTPPYHLPLFASAVLNRNEGFVGISTGLTVTVSGLKYILPGDALVFEIFDGEDTRLFRDTLTLEQDGAIDAVSYSIPDILIQALDAGAYTFAATVRRSEDETGTAFSVSYTVHALPEIQVRSVTPAIIQRPLMAGNNELALAYEVTGAGIEQIANTFTVAGASASETVKSSELLKVNATTLTARIYDASVVFTVTDPSFKLVSFKFLFGNYTATDEVDYRIDGTTVMKGSYPMSGWVEYVAPSPVALAPGSHTIRLYNSPSYWYLYSTTAKPAVSGMEFTSATLYAMEMVYAISTSGVSGERTVTLTLDDTAEAGNYPVAVESAAALAGYGVYTFNTTTGDMLEVLAGAAPEPEIGGVALNQAGRYKGCETDVTVSVSGLENILAGDALIVKLMSGGVVCYEHTGTLAEGATNYNLTIPASAFTGLAVGAYTVTAAVSRDEVVKDASTAYTVVAAPVVSFVSITPDTVQLPISAPLTLTAAWKATGDGINNIQGIVSLAGTAYTANVNTASLNFNTALTNVATLDAGLYSLAGAFTISSNAYGAVTANTSASGVLEVLAAVLEPQIGGVTVNPPGRYVGSESDVSVLVSGLQDVLGGDVITIRLCQNNAVFYEYQDALTADATDYSHTVPKSAFTGLGAGVYDIKAVIKRGGITSNEPSATYTAAAKPTIKLVSVTPDKIQLPIQSPQTVAVALTVTGAAIQTITGTVGLGETAYSAGVNVTGTDISVSLSGIQSLAARGYTVTAALTVVSNLYGTALVNTEFDNALRVLDMPAASKNLNSGDLYLYKGFTLVAVIRHYISFKWIRRYNKPGEFLLQLENTPANIRLIRSGNIIAKDNDDEAGLIEDVIISDKIEARGLFISKVLSYRIVNCVSEYPVDLKETANRLVTENFIAAAPERVVPGFRVADYNLGTQYVPAKIENGSILQWLEGQDAGFRVRFLPAESAYEFMMYDGRYSDAVFCENYRNISDQRYYGQTANVKNVCYVERDEFVTEVGSASGLDRREAYARAGKYDANEYGLAFLKQNKPVESLDVKIINPYAPFEYKRDYDVGDIVKVISEDYGVEITHNILEVTEFWDSTGFHLYIVFGDIPRDLLTELQDKDDRLEELEKTPDPLSEEALRGLLDLVIPDIVDEVYSLLEFDDLPTDEELTAKITDIAGNIINERLSGIGGGKHIILDHKPSKAEYDTYTIDDIVVVYNPDAPYVPDN